MLKNARNRCQATPIVMLSAITMNQANEMMILTIAVSVIASCAVCVGHAAEDLADAVRDRRRPGREREVAGGDLETADQEDADDDRRRRSPRRSRPATWSSRRTASGPSPGWADCAGGCRSRPGCRRRQSAAINSISRPYTTQPPMIGEPERRREELAERLDQREQQGAERDEDGPVRGADDGPLQHAGVAERLGEHRAGTRRPGSPCASGRAGRAG